MDFLTDLHTDLPTESAHAMPLHPGGRKRRMMVCFAAAVLAAALSVDSACADDWPMWHCTPDRGASSKQELPPVLHLQWSRRYRSPKQAWPQWREVRFDVAYKPVVMGKRMFLGSSRNDSLIALDADSGAELWRFYADGPIRLAPVAWNKRVYFASDDGYLYCLDAAAGTLIWKFRGGPSDRRCIGNERLISAWAARGGPVLVDGTIYFVAGFWPFDGIFIHALDAITGRVRWTNGTTGYREAAPQGHLVVVGNYLLAPCGRSKPLILDRRTGKFLSFPGGRHHHDGFGRGGSTVIGAGKYFVCRGSVCSIPGGSNLFGVGSSFVADGQILYSVQDRRWRGNVTAFEARDLAKPEVKTVKDRRGRTVRQTSFPRIWAANFPYKKFNGTTVYLKAGSRLYCGRGETVFSLDLNTPLKKNAGKVEWRVDVDEPVAGMIAANDKLYVVTSKGGLYCFGAKETKPKRYPAPKQAPVPPADKWTRAAEQILRATGAREGYCVVLGVGTGRLAEELARQSELPVIVVDPDAKKVNELRRKLDEAGLYGERCAVHVGSFPSFALSPYMAGLIVSEDPEAAGFGKGTAFTKKVFEALRPYGGTVCLAVPAARHDAFARNAAGIQNAKVKRVGDFSLLIRSGALPGSADWTHENATAGNTRVSRDTLVKPPFGALWFGGAADRLRYFDRHLSAPRPQVAGGRIITNWFGEIRALDAYTGRLLWRARAPGFGTTYMLPRRLQGATYVSLPDVIYVQGPQHCLCLDAATGRKLGELKIPSGQKEESALTWAYLGVWKDVLVGGGNPSLFLEKSDWFTAAQFKGHYGPPRLPKIKGFKPAEKQEGETELDYVVRNLNILLETEGLDKKIKLQLQQEVRRGIGRRRTWQVVNGLLRKYKNLRQRKSTEPEESYKAELRRLNRQLIETCFGLFGKWVMPGERATWARRTSKRLAGLDRHTGRVLWTRDATYAFRSIVLGGGRVFCLDQPGRYQARALKARGKSPGSATTLLALDIRTGKTVWTAAKNFAGWLAYSESEDILVLHHGCPDGVLSRHLSSWMAAYRGKDGKLLWSKQVKGLISPPLLCGRMALDQRGSGVDLHTGAPNTYRNPITGVRTPFHWRPLHRSCSDYIGGEHLVVFRLGPGGYYDLKNHTGVGYLSGFRASCHVNMIIADGVLSVPNVAVRCTCPYPVHASVGLVHVPENEEWGHYQGRLGPLRHVGLNFGAPGTFLAKDGTFWINVPARTRKLPQPAIKLTPAKPEWFCRHTSRMKGKGLRKVGASGVRGLRTLRIDLNPRTRRVPKKPYTIRLFFAEPDSIQPGKRLFNVSLQGKIVLSNFDVVREAGGPHKTIFKEFKGVRIGKILELTLDRSGSDSELPPILCGLMLRREH